MIIVSFKQGGAIATEAGSNLVAVDTQFHFNRASSGGALYVSGYSNLDVRATSFDSNFALDGGAIYNRGVSSMYDSTFLDNFSEDGVSRGTTEVLFFVVNLIELIIVADLKFRVERSTAMVVPLRC